MKPKRSTLERIRQYQTSLLEDIVAAVILFILVSSAWTFAPEEWPQVVYYFAIGVVILSYFRFVSPPPNER